MKKSAFILALVMLSPSLDALAQSKLVEGNAVGKYENEITGRFEDEPIFVATNPDGLLIVSGGGGARSSNVIFPGSQTPGLISALEKAQEWGRLAAENKLATSKSIAEFEEVVTDSIKHTLVLHFFSSEDGQSYHVDLGFNLHKGKLQSTELALDPDQVAVLISLLKKLPETYRSLLADKAKADELLK